MPKRSCPQCQYWQARSTSVGASNGACGYRRRVILKRQFLLHCKQNLPQTTLTQGLNDPVSNKSVVTADSWKMAQVQLCATRYLHRVAIHVSL